VAVENLYLPPHVKNFIQDYLNGLVDPSGEYYNKSEISFPMGKKVATISPNIEDYKTKEKGFDYDPYLKDFAIGANGIISSFEKQENTSYPLVIRGLGTNSQRALEHCMQTGRDFYAIDTGYMQPGKHKTYHRITKNALQNLGPIVDRPDDRLRLLNWKYRKPTNGSKILLCPPSEKVMKFYKKNLDEWMDETIKHIKTYTTMPIEVRLKPIRSERVSSNTIWEALEDAHCLVTFNSIAASEALLFSVPAIALAPNAASVLCNTSISDINNLYVPTKEEIHAFARHLSYCQFTTQEMRSGYAWSILNEGH
jgi:hypothetical protein